MERTPVAFAALLTWALLLPDASAAVGAAVSVDPARASAFPVNVSDPPSCGAREPGDTRPRIGLALGGGGARGVAHVSVLRKLEALHIPVDCVAGTSMGALVGGLYASGIRIDEMEQLVRTTNWDRLFDDSIPRPERSYRSKLDDRDGLATLGVGVGGRSGLKVSPGVLQGERILALFERSTLAVSAVDDFDALPIPYRAVATDLNTGAAVVIDRGSLAMAMRASMSLPGIFQPVEIDGRVLVDGGVANQVPVDVVRAMGADVVIAVDVGTPLEALDRDASLLSVISQLSGMLTTGNTQRMLATLEPTDVLITPELGDEVATGDFDKADAALAIGARAAEGATASLSRLSVDEPRYRQLIARRAVPDRTPPVVEFVRLENETPYDDRLILERSGVRVGEPLDTTRVEAGVLGLYGLGTLASVTYELVREQDRNGVLLRAREKPQGPNYVQVGLTASNDFQGGFESNLRFGLLFSPLTAYGAEGRIALQIGSEPGLAGEYYHPLDLGSRYLLRTKADYRNPRIRVYDELGRNFASYDVQSVGVSVQARREFGNHATAGIGLERRTGEASVETGLPLLPSFDFDTGRAVVFASVDRLDSLFFPRQGYASTLSYSIAREWLGSDDDYAQVDFDALFAAPFGRHSVQLGASAHVTTEGTLPVQDRYRIGGRGRLVGYRFNELTGQHYALVFMGYTRQLAEVFGRSAFVGGTLEYGNAWEDRDDIAWAEGVLNVGIYAGFDSWIGPMLFGYGQRDGGDGVVFLEIGKPF